MFLSIFINLFRVCNVKGVYYYTFAPEYSDKSTMNLSERSRVDKELFSGERRSYENTLTFRFFSVFSYERRSPENSSIITHSLHNIAINLH